MVATKTTTEIVSKYNDIDIPKKEWLEYIEKEWVSLDELRKYIDEKLEYDFCDNDWERGFQDGLKHIKERFFAPVKITKATIKPIGLVQLSNQEGLSKEVRSGDRRKDVDTPGGVMPSSLASHRKRENKR